MDGRKETAAERKEYALLAPLAPDEFESLKSAMEETDVFKAAEILSAGAEDVFHLIVALERFTVTDGDVVRMTAHEHRSTGGGSAPAYERGSESSYARGVRNALNCLKEYPDIVRELVVPEADMRLPEFRFAALKAVMQGIPVREVAEGFGGMTAVLEKRHTGLSGEFPHAVLHQVMNPGNIGAVIRSAVAFGIRDIAMIDTGTDEWDPEIIAVSRCASLAARIECFESISEYTEKFPEHALYPLMLRSAVPIDEAVCRGVPERYSIVLGNESRGLPDAFSQMGTPVKIPMETVESLNVSAAAAVAFYAFKSRKTD